MIVPAHPYLPHPSREAGTRGGDGEGEWKCELEGFLGASLTLDLKALEHRRVTLKNPCAPDVLDLGTKRSLLRSFVRPSQATCPPFRH